MTTRHSTLAPNALEGARLERGETALAGAPDSALVGGRRLWSIALVIGVGGLPALFAHDVITQVASLHALAAEPYPYLQTGRLGLLYAAAPAVAISAFLLFLAPGAVLALAFGQVRSAAEWVVFAFGGSLLLCIGLGTGAKLALGTPLTPAVLLSLWLGTTALGWGLLAHRLSAGTAVAWPIATWPDTRRLLWSVGIAFLAICVLLPKIFWENFNVDGIEAFEFGRSLSTHLLPYWEVQDGTFGFYHNFVLFAYPNHWFITLLGPIEAAVRLPFVLYVVVLFFPLVLLCEWRNERSLSGAEEAALWLGLACYTVVQAFDATYEPFFADMAETAGSDTLLVACFLSSCYALWTSRWGWFGVFGIMTHLAAPGGLLLLGALAAATFLAKAPERRRQLAQLALVVGLCLLIWIAHELLYNPIALAGATDQFSAKNMLRRLYPPTLTEFARLNALLFPSGILPALALLEVRRRRDLESWIIALVTVGYFGVIYTQAWTSLHQFTPIMILPLVVFWRLYLRAPERLRRLLLPLIGATTAASLVLSLPRHAQINQAVRAFGQSTEYKIGDYDAAYEQAVRAKSGFDALLPAEYRLQYPDQAWGTDALSLIYYATRERPAGAVPNYVIQEATDPAPPGAVQVRSRDGVAVYVRDQARWQEDRNPDVPRVVVSALYEPILRRTSEFFRAYDERMRQRAQERATQP